MIYNVQYLVILDTEYNFFKGYISFLNQFGIFFIIPVENFVHRISIMLCVPIGNRFFLKIIRNYVFWFRVPVPAEPVLWLFILIVEIPPQSAFVDNKVCSTS